MSEGSGVNIGGTTRVYGPVVDKNDGSITANYNTTNTNYGDIGPFTVTAEAQEAAERRLAALPEDIVSEIAPLPPGSRMQFAHNPLFVGRVNLQDKWP